MKKINISGSFNSRISFLRIQESSSAEVPEIPSYAGITLFRHLLMILVAALTTLTIYSCQDSLGVDNTKYIKETMIDTLSRDTVIIDYKRIIITYYVVQHDTIIKFDTIPVTRDPVFASKYNLSVIEKFTNNKDIDSSSILTNINSNLKFSYLNYNKYLPELNISFDIINADSSEFKKNLLRTELLSKLSFKFDSLQISSDSPQYLNEIFNSNQAELNIIFLKREPRQSIMISPGEIYGSIYFTDRKVEKGQLSSITMNLNIMIPSLKNQTTGDYAVNILINLVFPTF
jgi:hypothetical protein